MTREGEKVADGYLELHVDDSNLKPEVRAKAKRVGKEFGGELNKSLRALNVDEIDIKADPKSAVRTMDELKIRLKAMSADAATIEVKVRTEKALSELTRFRKQIGDVTAGAGPEAGRRFGKELGDALDDALPTNLSRAFRGGLTSPAAIAAIGAGAVFLGPTIGGIIAGAVIGGVGLGGIVGGVYLAAKDPVIVQYAQDIGARFKSALRADALTAFRTPILQALGDVDGAADQTAGKVGRIFANTAPALRGFTANVLEAGSAILDSLVTASGKSQPVLAELGRLVTNVSVAFANMITTLSEQSKGAAAGLQDLSDIVVFLVYNFSEFTAGLAQARGGIQASYEATQTAVFWLEKHARFLDLTNDGYKAGSEATKLYRAGIIGASGSVNDYNAYLKKTNATQAIFQGHLEEQIATEDQVKAAQEAVTASQKDLKASLDSLGGATTLQSQNSAALKTAMDNLYGATIRQSDANQTYEASWDSLSSAVKTNSRTLDVHTEAGRNNRTAMINLLNSTNDLYLADINAGKSIAEATKKHNNRIAAIKEESHRLGLNTTKTQELINTYGKIPPKKTTDILIGKVADVVNKLKDLYIVQRALAEGIPINAARAAANNKSGPDKPFGGFAGGGYTGSGIHGTGGKFDPAGVVHAREWVHPQTSVQYYGPKVMSAIQNRQIPRESIPGYASGGLVAPVETRGLRYLLDVGMTHIMTKAQALARVVPTFSAGNWPSSPGAQRGDSGVWRKIVALVNASGIPHSFGNGYRPGDPLWHGSGRAVDWMGFNQDRLARFFLARQGSILEMIHRTRSRDYAYTRGKNKGSFNETLMNQHRNHLHIAMDDSGQIMPGWNSIYNGTGRPEAAVPGPMMDAVVERLDRLVAAAQTPTDLTGGGVGVLAEAIGAAVADALASSARRAVQIGRGRSPVLAGRPA